MSSRRSSVPLMVWKDTPDILRLPDIKADLYGGTLDGQGRIELGSIFRYELVLNASRIQLEKLGGVLRIAGRYSEALAVLEEAATLYARRGDPDGAGRVVAHIGRIHATQGTTERGIARVQAHGGWAGGFLQRTHGIAKAQAFLQGVPGLLGSSFGTVLGVAGRVGTAVLGVATAAKTLTAARVEHLVAMLIHQWSGACKGS